jgi:hypothetical protein
MEILLTIISIPTIILLLFFASSIKISSRESRKEEQWEMEEYFRNREGMVHNE